VISQQDIERISALKSEHGVLSAYIRIDPRLRYVRKQAEAQFKGALKDAQRRIQQRWREALEREGEHVRQFLVNWEPLGRGVAIFSSQPAGIWEVLSLDVLGPNFVDVDFTTKTGILAQLLDELPVLVVPLVQRDRATIYVAEQGTSKEGTQVASEVPGQHDQGGRAQARFQRHIEFHVAEHLKRVVDELKKLVESRSCTIAIGATEETAHEIMRMLPEPIARRVIGSFPIDPKHETEQHTLERALRVWEEHERSHEQALVEEVFNAAKSGGQGVLGIQPTLNALVEEKVRTLLMVEGLAIEGSVCTECGYFAAPQFRRCPLCGGNAATSNIAGHAIEKAYTIGANVEVVYHEARKQLLTEEGLGALLRY
jgi:peptide chain release factor subunit 1